MKKGFTILGIILLLSLIITSNASAITGKIGNGKMIITADVGESVSRTIRVRNDNDVAVNITIFASGDSEKDITIIDKTFILQPNEEKNAQFTVKVTKTGNNKINVRFQPLTDEPGVGLSAQLTVKTNGKETNGEGGTTNNNNNDLTGEVTAKLNPDNQRNTFLIIMGVLTLILLIILVVLLSSGKSKSEIITSNAESQNKIKEGVK